MRRYELSEFFIGAFLMLAVLFSIIFGVDRYLRRLERNLYSKGTR